MPAMTEPDRGSEGAFRVRSFRNDDEGAVLALLQSAFGVWPRDLPGQDGAEMFRWKHTANPFGRSLMVVAETDDALVGFAAWLRWRVAADDHSFEVLRCVDVAVDPAFQGRGVYRALVRDATAMFPPDTSFTLSTPNELSRPGSLSAGAAEVDGFGLLVRPRPIRCAVRLVGHRRSGRRHEPCALPGAEPAAVALLGDGGLVNLLSAVEQPATRFTTIKDLGYLAWRYGSLEAYQILCEYRNGRVVGLAIFRIRDRGSASVLALCELLVARGDHPAARRLLTRLARSAPVDYLICRFPPGSIPRRAAARRGFIRVPGGPVPTVRRIAKDISPDPLDPESWAICLGDLDLL